MTGSLLMMKLRKSPVTEKRNRRRRQVQLRERHQPQQRRQRRLPPQQQLGELLPQAFPFCQSTMIPMKMKKKTPPLN